MADEQETRYRQLEAQHRELEREVQSAANREREDLRTRLAIVEQNYMKRENLEARFEDIIKRTEKLEVKVYGLSAALVLVEILFKLSDHFKP